MAAMVAASNTISKPKTNTFLSSEIYDGSNAALYSANAILPDIYVDNNQKNNFESTKFNSTTTQLNSNNFTLTHDLKEIFSYINNYTPETIKIETMLQPFLLDYVPAVGDVDPFIKVTMPDQVFFFKT